MIWSTGIKEAKTTTHGGKGPITNKGSAINYTYSASFAFAFCAGPCDRILRIWADSKLVYDTTGAALAIQGANIRQYFGDENQLPDSAIVADKGTGNVPGFRGLVYIVADDVPLAPFGNRIPNITAEVAFAANSSPTLTIGTTAVATADNPFDMGAYFVQPDFVVDYSVNRGYRRVPDVDQPTGGGIEVFDLSTMQVISEVDMDSLYAGSGFVRPTGAVIQKLASGDGTDLYAAIGTDGTPNAHLVRINPTSMKVTGDFFDGDPFSSFPYTLSNEAVLRSVPSWTGSAVNKNYITDGTIPFRAIVGFRAYLHGPQLFDGAAMQWMWGSAAGTEIAMNFKQVSGDMFIPGAVHPDGSCAFWFLNSGNTDMADNPVTAGIDVWHIVVGAAAAVTSTLVLRAPATELIVGATNIYVSRAEYDAANQALLIWISPAVNTTPYTLVSVSTATGLANWTYGIHDSPGWVWSSGQSNLSSNTIGFVEGNPSGGFGTVATQLNTSSGAVISQTATTENIGPFGTAYNSATQAIYQVDVTNRYTNSILFRAAGAPEALSIIVHDICVEAGLTDDDIDVTQLTDMVRGYSHAQEIARNLLTDLAGVFFFDGAESDYTLRFVKRGGAPALTIPYGDVVPSGQAAALPIARNQAEDIPRRIWVRYPDTDHDQQQGTQYWARSQAPDSVAVINSAGEQTMDLRVVYTADEAKTLARKRLLMLWTERSIFSAIGLPPRYLRLDPTDVVTVTLRDGDTARVRLERVALGGDLSLQAAGVIEDETLLTITATGDSGSGLTTPTIIPTPYVPVPVQAEMPLVRDTDDTSQTALREYAAFGAHSGQTFGGATMYVSADNATWSPLISSTTSMKWGSAINALPAPPILYTTDTTNHLDVSMANGGTSLETATTSQILEGANPAILITASGDVEVIQYETVTPQGGNVYRLTNLQRGRRGTEWVVGLHAAGDKFVMLETATWRETTVPLAWLNTTRYEKTVGALDIFDAIPSSNKTFKGTAEKPYAPVFIQGSYDGSNNLTITWIRRTRIGAEWLDGVEVVPLSEASESYSIDILSSGSVVRTLTSSTPTVEYTNTQQAADGLDLSDKDVRVYQISAIVGRGNPGTATIASRTHHPGPVGPPAPPPPSPPPSPPPGPPPSPPPSPPPGPSPTGIPMAFKGLYLLTDPIVPADIGAAPVDVAVIEPTSDGGTVYFDSSDVTAMKSGGAKVLLYWDIGEFETFRDYAQSGSPPGGTDPALWGLAASVPHNSVDTGWPGDYYVQYWNSGWQTLAIAMADKAIALGYDGIYFDVVDSCQSSYAISNVPSTNGKAAHSQDSAFEAMNNLIAAVRTHATGASPGFLIMANGSEEGFAYSSDYAANIDLFWKEECFYSNNPDFPSFQIDTGYADTVANIQLARTVTATMPLAVVEYVSGTTAITDAKAKAAAASFGYYIANPTGDLSGIDTDGF